MFFSRISIKDKALFYENIANLLEWWVTLTVALKWLRDRLPEWKLKEAMDHLVFFIESGDAVNVAMRKLPNFFWEQEVAIVESGEQTGMIQESFLAIANDLRWQEDLRNKITSAMTYPVIIMIFLVLAVMVVMVYVVPQLIPIITNMSSELPIMTKALIGTSTFLKENIMLLLLWWLWSWLIITWYLSSEVGAYQWDRQKILLPVVWPVYKNYLIVRTMSTFHLLSNAGVSIVKSMQLTGESSGNAVIKKMYSLIAQDIASWNKISASLSAQDSDQSFFTIDIIQMIESAERTSTIGAVAAKISTQYKREVDFALANMVKYIEPIALLTAGIFVLWFAIAIFWAIMQIVGIAWQ